MKHLKRKIAAVLMAAAMSVTAFPATSFAETALMQDSVTVEYNAKVAKPSYMIKGTPGKRKIKLTCSTKGATIYYTTDGSTPTTSDKKYKGLITITKKTKIRAIAVLNGSKSAVMTKTVDVKTLLGDATGDGKVNQNDYIRYKNYRNGKTTYICKDNCDMDGSGGLSAKDLRLLKEYLEEDSETETEEETTVDKSIDKPDVTVYKAYGGYKFKATTHTDGAKLYYTINGSTPDKNDYEYKNKMVEIDESCTLKVVAYKNGSYSEVKTRNLTLKGECEKPYADKDAEVEYSDSVKVTLKCDTDNSRILYTTDGKDPVEFGRVYSGPIELTSNTTLKFVAQAKAYSNSKVVTLDYKVKSSKFTIKGRVWDDTGFGVADGKYYNGEEGINGITVHLLNTSTNKYDQTTTTSTINGIPGSYELNKGVPGTSYRVVFQFNGQRYRPYGSIVAGGNQALINGTIPALVVKMDGTYSDANKLLVRVNNYGSAILHTYFNSTLATTANTYNDAAENVNLALRGDIYGITELSFVDNKVTGYDTGKTVTATPGLKVFENDTIAHTLRVTNKSTAQDLKKAEIMVHLDPNVEIQSIKTSDGLIATYALQGTDTSTGKVKYLVTCPEVKAGKTLDFVITVRVRKGVKNGVGITSFAEIYSYQYSESCYQKNSTPANFKGSVAESDEAATVKVAGYESLTDSQTIEWVAGNDFATPIAVGTARAFKFNIKNGTNASDYVVKVLNPAVISYETFCAPTDTGTVCTILVTGKAVGTTDIIISLKKDAEKTIAARVTVA